MAAIALVLQVYQPAFIYAQSAEGSANSDGKADNPTSGVPETVPDAANGGQTTAAANAGSPAISSGAAPDKTGGHLGLLNSNAEVNTLTGSFSNSIPILVPEAAHKMAPSLALGYDSNAGNGWVGVGWNLGTDQVYRVGPSQGVPTGTTSDKFWLSYQGANYELLPTGLCTGTGATCIQRYRTRIETFLYVVANMDAVNTATVNYWTVINKEGEPARFGYNTDSETPNVQWLLDQELDTFGNKIEYAYTALGTDNVHYLSTISWGGNDGLSRPNVFSVEFESEMRPDRNVSYSRGLKQVFQKRLKNVRVERLGTLLRRYQMFYDADASAAGDQTSGSTGRSLLTSVRMYGTDDVTALPDITMQYSSLDYTWHRHGGAGLGGEFILKKETDGEKSGGVQFVDLDGDGAVEKVDFAEDLDGSFPDFVTEWEGVRFETRGNSGLPGVRFARRDTQEIVSPHGTTFIDLNGDAIPDKLDSETSAVGLQTKRVYIGVGDGTYVTSGASVYTESPIIGPRESTENYCGTFGPGECGTVDFQFVLTPDASDFNRNATFHWVTCDPGSKSADYKWYLAPLQSGYPPGPAGDNGNYVDYQGLAPGQYVFHVKSINSKSIGCSGIPGELEKTYSFQVNSTLPADGIPPTLYWAEKPTEGTFINTGTTFRFSWIGNDDGGGPVDFRYYVEKRDPEDSVFQYSVWSSSSEVTLSAADIPSGGGRVTVFARDADLNISTPLRIEFGRTSIVPPGEPLAQDATLSTGGRLFRDVGARLADLDADGFVDKIDYSFDQSTNTTIKRVYLWRPLTGRYQLVSAFNVPGVPFANLGLISDSDDTKKYAFDGGSRLMDINGDGIADKVDFYKSGTSTITKNTYLGTGSGFTAVDPAWACPGEPLAWFKTDKAVATGAQLLDMNGDGLPDKLDVYKTGSGSGYIVANLYLNNGNGWNASPIDPNWPGLAFCGRYGGDLSNTNGFGTLLVDLDGDTLLDKVDFDARSNSQLDITRDVYIRHSHGPGGLDIPDRLLTVKNAFGGQTSVEYGSSALWTAPQDYPQTEGETGPHMPFPVIVVTRLTQSDGRGTSSIMDFEYREGRFDGAEHTFVGFGETTRIQQANGIREITRYNQSFPLAGTVASVEVRKEPTQASPDGLLVTKTDNIYDTPNLGGIRGPFLVNLTSVDTYQYEDGLQFLHTRKEIEYDAYGLVTKESALFDVDDPNDDLYTFREYIHKPNDNLLGFLMRSYVTDDAEGTHTLMDSRYFYDNAAYGDFTLGVPRATERWLDYDGNLAVADRWIRVEEFTYDPDGNPRTVTSANGRVQTTTYDPSTGTLVTQETNPKNQSVTHTYDTYGRRRTSTNPNGITGRVVYDPLGRPIQEYTEFGANSFLMSETFFVNLGNPATQYVEMKTLADFSPVTRETARTYLDGLGREYRTEGEVSAGRTVRTDTVYDALGNVERKSEPYFVGATPQYTQASFDDLGRITTTTGPGGVTESRTYDRLSITHTDPIGKLTVARQNSQQKLESVTVFREAAGGPDEEITTQYVYDFRGSIASVLDGSGTTLIHLDYDTLGRKISHFDINKGLTRYFYDDDNNLTFEAKIEPADLPCPNRPRQCSLNPACLFQCRPSPGDLQGVASEWTRIDYDELNRPTAKTLSTGEVATYAWDSATIAFGIGKIATKTDATGTYDYRYDAFGHITQMMAAMQYQARTLNLAFSWQYDAKDRITEITYPDLTRVKYAYKAGGGVDRIYNPDTNEQYAVYNDYTALGQLDFVTFGNGSRVGYTYDPDRHDMTNILVTRMADNSVIQNLSYTLNNYHQVTATTDHLDPQWNESFTYDKSHQLVSASAGAYGTLGYSYDSRGNLLTKGNLTYDYLTFYRVGFVTETGGGTRSFGYDDFGRTTSITQGSDTLQFFYNAADQTTRFDVNGLIKGVYVYNDEGVRTIRETEDEVVFYFGDLWEVKFPKDQAIALTTKRIKTDAGQVIRTETSAATVTAFLYTTGEQYLLASLEGVAPGLWPWLTRVLPARFQLLARNPANQMAAYRALWISVVCMMGLLLIRRRRSVRNTLLHALSGFLTGLPWLGPQALEPVHVVSARHVGMPLYRRVPWLSALLILVVFSWGAPPLQAQIPPPNPETGVTWIVPDHLGSATILLDDTAQVKEHARYLPFGELKEGGSGVPGFRDYFLGKKLDPESGLYQMGARYYDPILARFLTPDSQVPDPKDPLAYNPYSYARNHPINLSDRTGESWLSDAFKKITKFLGENPWIVAALSIWMGNVALGMYLNSSGTIFAVLANYAAAAASLASYLPGRTGTQLQKFFGILALGFSLVDIGLQRAMGRAASRDEWNQLASCPDGYTCVSVGDNGVVQGSEEMAAKSLADTPLGSESLAASEAVPELGRGLASDIWGAIDTIKTSTTNDWITASGQTLTDTLSKIPQDLQNVIIKIEGHSAGSAVWGRVIDKQAKEMIRNLIASGRKAFLLVSSPTLPSGFYEALAAELPGLKILARSHWLDAVPGLASFNPLRVALGILKLPFIPFIHRFGFYQQSLSLSYRAFGF